MEKGPSPIVRDIEKEMASLKRRKMTPVADSGDTGPKEVKLTVSAEDKKNDGAEPVGILEVERERTIKKLAAEIKRRSWLDENTSDIDKSIPEIGQDLRAETIRKMLKEEYQLEADTEPADEKMAELYEIWARKWMDALEKQKAGREKPATDDEVRDPKDAREPAALPAENPVATLPAAASAIDGPAASLDGLTPREAVLQEVKNFQESVSLAREIRNLPDEKKNIFDDLQRKARIDKMAKTLGEKYKTIDPAERKKAESEKNSLFLNIREDLLAMVKNESGEFPEENLKYFQKYFLNPELMRSYQDIRQEEVEGKKVKDLTDFRYEFAEEMGKMAQEHGKFKKEAVELVKSFFRSFTLLEQRYYENK